MTGRSAFSGFVAVFLADLLVRTAYMSGKSPVLPVFADSLGANEVVLGMIVSVSILTGLFLKPVFGFLSDRTGKLVWLMVGTALFALTPFIYSSVTTTEELVALRLFHGLATAIYGPVTLAYVASFGERPKAERFGWFGLARTGSYVLGPLVGGALLAIMTPQHVYAVTGFIALAAFIPVAFLASDRDGKGPRAAAPVQPLGAAITASVRELSRNRPLLVFAIIEMTSRIGLYAVKTFLPLMILAKGGSPLEAGVFLSVQEATAAAIRPAAGRIADRTGERRVAVFGLGLMAVALTCLPHALEASWLVGVAVVLGAAHGAFAPAALSLITAVTPPDARGAAFGVVGALRNAGKLIGPIAAGWLLYLLPVNWAFLVLGLVPMLTAAMLTKGTAEIGNASRAFLKVVSRLPGSDFR